MHVVAIGGGTGLYTLLRGLKRYSCDITAIVTTADNGGSTGTLCDEYGVLPPGDIRRCLVALSESREVVQEVCEHRFHNGSFGGHTVGNVIITALEELYGKGEGVAKTAELLNINGTVLPVTTDSMQLQAILTDGTQVQGESAIDHLTEENAAPIDYITTQETVSPEPAVLHALETADVIVLGPGDLYTSIIPNLLVSGVPEAIAQSDATVVYNCNVMTKPGETDNFAVEDFIAEIEQYTGRYVDYVLYNTTAITDPLLRESYAQEGKYPVTVNGEMDGRFFGKDLMTLPDLIRHDPQKLARAVLQCAYAARMAASIFSQPSLQQQQH